MASTARRLGTRDETEKTTLNKSEACNQCRKRKVKCNGQRPCSSCLRTHQKIVRVNPHLSHAEPNCTYDQSPGVPSEPEIDTSESNLRKMEQRVEELERSLNAQSNSSIDGCTHTGGPKSVLSPEAVNPPNCPATIYNLNPNIGTESSIPTPLNDHDSLPFIPHPSSQPILADEWPPLLPPRPLMLHLIDLFFTCYPNSRRIIHRPTFLLEMMEHPSSPRFPFVPLLHSICAAAAVYSPLVAVAPVPDLHNHPAEDMFPEKTRMQQGRELMFDEQHYLLSKYECMTAAREGRDLMGVIQASIINGWWSFGCSRWFDLWEANSLAMRLCVALGLNLADSLQNPLPDKIRESLLIGAPLSHTDVELRRNIFWLSYCLERYHLSQGPWSFEVNDEDIHQTIPGTLEAFEAGFDDGQARQNIHSADLFTAHRNNVDDFGMYVKCAIMLSRLHVTKHRRLFRYDTFKEIQNSQELRALEEIVSSMKSSALKMQFNSIGQVSTSTISNTYMAHIAPDWALIKMHIYLADWDDPTCGSANKTLAAARSILRYIMLISSNSWDCGLSATLWDCSKLDRAACLCWASTGRALLFSLCHAPENLAQVLRAEIRLVRTSFLIAGDRIVLPLRQRHVFDREIVDHLGERDAAKVFAEDEA